MPLSAKIKSALGKCQHKAQELVNISMDQHVRLAVTGLSRAGKTAYITSLVNQLLQTPGVEHMPLWDAARERRLLGCKRVPQNNFHIPSFQYDQAMEQLGENPPRWPEPTSGVSEIRLLLRYRPESFVRRHLSDTANLTLEIVDYPGEWLLDLPLLQMDYLTWSEQIASNLEQGPRAELAKEWLGKGDLLDPFAIADEKSINEVAELYTDYLHRCKSQLGLHLIQPGRFVLPGELKGAPMLSFMPFVWLQKYDRKTLLAAAVDTNFGMLSARFEYYKEHVVKGFYHEYFAKFDRQVVLVDCLQPLNAGPDSFNDMQQAIAQIMQSFHYGKSGLLKRLFSPRIDKLLFAATKADHVTPEQHDNLVSLLSQLVFEGKKNASFEGIETQALALSAIKATASGKVPYQGGEMPAIRGFCQEKGEILTLFPGEVPAKLPGAEYWQETGFNFVAFQPEKLEGGSLPHIRVDQSLEFLLGDKF